MSISDLFSRAEYVFTRELRHLVGAEAYAARDVYSDDCDRMFFHAAASVLPLTDDEVFEIARVNPCVLQAPSPTWVFDELDLDDTPANTIRTQILYELWTSLAQLYEAMQMADPERIIVVVVGRNGLRLDSKCLPDHLFHTQLLA